MLRADSWTPVLLQKPRLLQAHLAGLTDLFCRLASKLPSFLHRQPAREPGFACSEQETARTSLEVMALREMGSPAQQGGPAAELLE